MWGQLESSLVVVRPVSRGPKSAPIIDRLCARIHNTPSTFLGVGDGGGAGLHHLSQVRSDHAHRRCGSFWFIFVNPKVGVIPVNPKVGVIPVNPEVGVIPVNPEDGVIPVNPEVGIIPVTLELGVT